MNYKPEFDISLSKKHQFLPNDGKKAVRQLIVKERNEMNQVSSKNRRMGT
jgi:hypothetical protein